MGLDNSLRPLYQELLQLDLLAKPFMPKNDKSSYYFYDINAKINHKFSDRSRLFLSAYNGKDHFGNKITEYSGYENKSKMDWGNTIISARWNFIFNNKLFSNTTVAFNKYRFYADTYTYSQHTDITTHQATTNKYSADYRSGIQDWSYKMDFDYHPTPAHRIKFGAEYLYHSFRPES